MDAQASTTGDDANRDDRASPSEPLSFAHPFKESIFRQCPIRRQWHAVLHPDPGQHAKGFAIAESFPRVAHVAITEPCVGQGPHGTEGSGCVHTAADCYGARPVEWIPRPSEQGHVLTQDLPVANPLYDGAMAHGRATALPHLEVLPIGHAPVRRLRYRH